MILVDTSVLVDFFKGMSNSPADRLKEIIERDIPFGITSVIYQEILQGARNKKEYELLETYLGCQRFYQPLDAVSSYAQAAGIYFACRKSGITIRSTIDCLIAQIAMEQDLLLLHNDRDFLSMARVINLAFY